MPKKVIPTFRPRARLMILLGDQLIRDAGIAVFELVKNAYDADASRCDVTLQDVHLDDEAALITVEDNGDGMDLDTIRNVWLSPGTRFRLAQRESTDPKLARTKKFHRLPLGEKGLGRFAVHKLGNKVEVVTRAKDSDEVVVRIDWKDFDSDEPLETIPVTVETRTPEVFRGKRHGTRIEISDLRERPWTRRRVRALHRAVTSICSPIEGPEDFEATLQLVPDPGKWLSGMLSPRQVMKLSLFRIKGRIESDHIIYDYHFKPPAGMDRVEARSSLQKRIPFPQPPHRKEPNQGLEEDERIIRLTPYRIGVIEFDFFVFDRERLTLSFMLGDSKTLTDFLNQNGGVRVYRDGVRVYDFGEPGNDWLDLGGRRVNVPTKRISNNQIIGVARVKLSDSQDLVEKTNREGFVENQAYVMFRRAINFAIAQAQTERNLDKDNIRKAYAKPSQKEPVMGDLAALRDALDALKLAETDSKRLTQYVDQIESQYREVLDRLLTAAGAGLNLAIVLHEVEKNIKTLYEVIARGETGATLLQRAKTLAELVDSLTWLTRQSGKAEVTAADLIGQCLFAWRFRFERHEISVTNGLKAGDPGFSVRCSRRLIVTALMNLVDNAIYWLGTKPTDRSLYLGTTYELTGEPALVVADNGPGFCDPPEYLTTPFFTRKSDGMGLGLHLADEIMKSQGGRVAFPDRGDITLPKRFDGAVVLLQFETDT